MQMVVISLPTEVCEDVKKTYTGYDLLYVGVKYGIPLDKVLEGIKAEITEHWRMYEYKFDVSDCLDIIDKHISGKESE